MAGLRPSLRTLRCRPRGRAHARLGADVDRYSVITSDLLTCTESRCRSSGALRKTMGSTMVQWPRLGSRQIRREAAWPSMPATSSIVSARP